MPVVTPRQTGHNAHNAPGIIGDGSVILKPYAKKPQLSRDACVRVVAAEGLTQGCVREGGGGIERRLNRSSGDRRGFTVPIL
eukprot:COSAG02_NODE_2381_length_8995_cov_3.430980_1_plen_82_part_00